jgi:hypothetical protein
MPRRATSLDRRAVLAWLCLASLASRSEDYPVLVTLGSAQVSVQDVLFGALIICSVPLGVAWVRSNRVIAGAMGIFCALLVVAALRSPVGHAAVVAVGKYLEFVLAGAAIALNVRRLQDPRAFTWALVGATVANLVVAVGQSLSDAGLSGPLTVRTGGLLALESAAALAIVTMAWCLVRLSRADRRERAGAAGGILAALALLLLAKSVLAAAALLALAIVARGVQSRTALRAATAGSVVVLALIVTVGRNADLHSAIAGSAVPTVALPTIGPGAPGGVPPRYALRQPARVTGGSFVHRVALGYVGARIALDAPLLGRGWQSTSSPDFLQQGPYDRYMVDRFPDLDPQLFVSSLPNGPHNAYIQLIAEAGWPAALALVVALMVTLVGGFAASRHAKTEDWTIAVGAAWVAVMAIFLMSASLFGGQLETSILGAAVVLGAPAAGLAAVRARTWLAAAAAVLVAAAVVAAGLFVPTSDAQAPAIARVRALVDHGRGSELFRRGEVPAGADLVLDNGLLQAQLGSRAVTIVARTAGDRSPVVLAIRTPRRIAGEFITHREADIISVEARDSHGTPVLKLALRRGIPGMFLELAPGVTLRGGRAGAVLHGPILRTATFPVGALLTSHLRGRGTAALVPATPRTVLAVLADHPAAGVRAVGGERFLVGILPRVRRATRAPLVRGAYIVVRPGSATPVPVVREHGLPRRRSALVVPYLLDDREHSGLAELLGYDLGYGRRLGPLP